MCLLTDGAGGLTDTFLCATMFNLTQIIFFYFFILMILCVYAFIKSMLSIEENFQAMFCLVYILFCKYKSINIPTHNGKSRVLIGCYFFKEMFSLL